MAKRHALFESLKLHCLGMFSSNWELAEFVSVCYPRIAAVCFMQCTAGKLRINKLQLASSSELIIIMPFFHNNNNNNNAELQTR